MIESVKDQLAWLELRLPSVQNLALAHVFGSFAGDNPQDIDVAFFSSHTKYEGQRYNFSTGMRIFENLKSILKEAEKHKDFLPFDFTIFSVYELSLNNLVTFPEGFLEYMSNSLDTTGQIAFVDEKFITKPQYIDILRQMHKERVDNSDRRLRTTAAARDLGGVRQSTLLERDNFSKMFYQDAVRNVLHRQVPKSREGDIMEMFYESVDPQHSEVRVAFAEDPYGRTISRKLFSYLTSVEGGAYLLNQALLRTEPK
jgi:hypothetical protein